MPEKSEHEILNEWALDTRLPATFTSMVWRRIERQPPLLGVLIAQWLARLFARPAAVAVYGAGALVIGLAAGEFHASHEVRKHESQLVVRYLETVDPYASRPER